MRRRADARKEGLEVKAHVSPSSPSSFSVMVTVWLNTASWNTFPCGGEEDSKEKSRLTDFEQNCEEFNAVVLTLPSL